MGSDRGVPPWPLSGIETLVKLDDVYLAHAYRKKSGPAPVKADLTPALFDAAFGG